MLNKQPRRHRHHHHLPHGFSHKHISDVAIEVEQRGRGRGLTEHSPGRDGLSVEPEGHLGEDDGHDAGEIRLDHKVTNFPLQVEVGRHHDVLSCGPEDRTMSGRSTRYVDTFTSLIEVRGHDVYCKWPSVCLSSW